MGSTLTLDYPKARLKWTPYHVAIALHFINYQDILTPKPWTSLIGRATEREMVRLKKYHGLIRHGASALLFSQYPRQISGSEGINNLDLDGL